MAQATTRTARTRMTNIVISIMALAFLIGWMVPVIAAILTSFRTNDEILRFGFWTLPQQVTLDNYIQAWNRGGLSRYMPNSFIITLPALVMTLFFSSLAAYALARFKFVGSRALYFVFVAGTLLPFQILLLPVFQLTNLLHIYDTYLAVIIFHTAFQLGFCTFVLRNYMRTVPGEILEAARIDGCGEFRTFTQIMLPLTLPAMAALATLQFTWIFNDFLWALILLQRDVLKPVTTGLATLQGQYISEWGVIVAGSLLGTLPTVIVFVLLQRYFITGLTLGATKG